ncbi:MAG: TfpX/TfpZ family type IV pilin accessory protein [Comamonadaceae bacterium]|nr:TfpX/TfpZ family type IV pilin accessory protein [Comamonadaceae bacterium]
MPNDTLNTIHYRKISPRVKAAFIHLLISAATALVVFALVFWLWYPAPHHQLSGGITLFLMLLGIDLVLGPLLTLVIFNIRKPRRELVRDLAIIGTVQLAALAYGMTVAYQARPVYVVFEHQRFRVVYGADLLPEFLQQSPEQFRKLPVVGPEYLSLRPMQPEERLDVLFQELSGFPLAYRADMWRPYADAKNSVLLMGKPMDEVVANLAKKDLEKLDALIQKKGLTRKDVLHLPLLSRSPDVAAAFVDGRTGEVLYIAIPQ